MNPITEQSIRRAAGDEVARAVRTLDREVATAFSRIPEAKLVGIYLTGSLARGGFDPASSDIDFLVVTSGPLSDQSVALLSNVHKRIRARGNWCARFDGSYIPADDMRSGSSAATYPRQDFYGGFARADIGLDYLMNRIAMNRGALSVRGPVSQAIVPDEISRDEIRRAMVNAIPYSRLARNQKPRPEDHVAIDVLTICRMLYTHDSGQVVSKQEAANWYLSVATAPSERRLVRRALEAWRGSERIVSESDRRQACAFIRNAIRRLERQRKGRDSAADQELSA